MSINTGHNPFVAPTAAVDDIPSQTDSVFNLNLFSSAGRIGRVRYLAYSMGFGILITLLGAGLSALISPVAIVFAYIPLFYVNFMLAIKRSHDFNVTGWLSLLAVVPLVNFLFLLVPGTDGPNRFGNKTAPNGNAGVIVVVAFVGIFLIGILAAIAIPAYQDYSQRARAAQGASAAGQNPAVGR